jgi:hypothetical protein
MKNTLLLRLTLLLLLGALAGCKKQIEQAKADAVVDVMVANKWVVLQYLDNGNNVTTEFDGFDFQFNRDYTVVGANGTISKTGTWSGNASNQTITANFANATSTPLTRLNGTWAIYYYDSNGPKFNQFINGVEMRLVLRKK